ncbi:MAG: 4-alpha-glucanotransferase [Lachnospiraceae bacterium]|nr:4-alpha-glucanotransferase [Lachnospiraceae bacterium]
MNRSSGILFPVSSIPSRYGIGCFSREAFEFVDFLEASGQTWWQVLPFGPTGYGDSPYQSFSTFAGNPYFISLDQLVEDGLLTEQECTSCYWGTNEEYVDYGAQYESRFKVLRQAYDRFKAAGKEKEEFLAFCKKEKEWLEDYCLFMALKLQNENRSWSDWDEPYKTRDRKAMTAVKNVIEDVVDFFRFQQYEFMKQWNKLHQYANEHGVKIIGDIPIYVAFDSADTWSHPEMFQFDDQLLPSTVAGCPPDAFSATGQLWGNPLYNWKYLKRTHYKWWTRRISRCLEFYDAIRIDHFRGFDEYYAVPYKDETAENGTWEPGPGMDLFKTIREELGDVEIIAEDLGLITPTVRQLLEDSGYPGMKVLQFAFDPSEKSIYLPYNHLKNCVVYTGTHDNMTTRGWIESISDHDRDFARRYIRSLYTNYDAFTWDFIREAHSSVADLVIVPLQDYLCKGNEARMNCPAVGTGNWQWRLKPNFLTKDLSDAIFEVTKTYGRLPVPEEVTEEETGETEKADAAEAAKEKKS